MLVVREGGEVELTWREHLGERLRHPAGGIRQVRRRGVTAKGRKQVPDRPFSGGQVDFLAAMHNAQTPTPVRAAGRHRDLMLEFGNANGQSFREMFV